MKIKTRESQVIMIRQKLMIKTVTEAAGPVQPRHSSPC